MLSVAAGKAAAPRDFDCARVGVPCQHACPAHTDIPGYLAAIAAGDHEAAYRINLRDNVFPGVLGRVCARPCEDVCRHGKEGLGEPVAICSSKRAAADFRADSGPVVLERLFAASGKRVAVVGAGPAGLACADVLVRNGVQPVVFDRYPEIGGLLTFGIPEFKLEKSVLARRRELFTGMGVEFRLGVEVGREVEPQALLDEFDALFLGLGTYRFMRGGFPGEDLAGVHDALPFLVGNVCQCRGWPAQSPYVDTAGLRVVVLGGGDTAMDCCRTAVRQGAASVTCAYRRDEANMPGSRREVANAREEGVNFLFNRQPVGILGELHCEGVELVSTELGEPDPSGRRRPVVVAGSQVTVAADLVLIAFGFRPSPPAWLARCGVELDEQGRVRAAPESGPFPLQTANAKIFAGGDMVRGSDLVVTAIWQGRQAARGILAHLGLD